jgi:putative membrane protein
MLHTISLASVPLADADWHGPGWWIVFVPLGWFLAVFVFFFIFRRVGGGPCCGWGYGHRYGRGAWRGHPDPGAVLDGRFAEGEIDADEYRSRRATLENAGQP